MVGAGNFIKKIRSVKRIVFVCVCVCVCVCVFKLKMVV